MAAHWVAGTEAAGRFGDAAAGEGDAASDVGVGAQVGPDCCSGQGVHHIRREINAPGSGTHRSSWDGEVVRQDFLYPLLSAEHCRGMDQRQVSGQKNYVWHSDARPCRWCAGAVN